MVQLSKSFSQYPKTMILVDDHAILRAGLKALIQEHQEEFKVIEEASNGTEAIDKIKKIKPDIVLLDISLPDISGLDLIDSIKKYSINTKILILSMFEDETMIVKALKMGANGFIPKRLAYEELIEALKTISKAEDVYVPSCLAKTVLRGMLNKDKKTKLSTRESQVLRYTALGYGNKEMAKKLNLSVKTIETYKLRISEKINAQKKSDLVKYAIKEGLLKEEEGTGISDQEETSN
ncbi:response regulator transcription factor [Thermodesulfobium acidiphilum]|uniref:response regulator transcription factor n=1 Tax=Thermodesulfobium acidiphilum TaxID=1794699 RepID=UPI001F2B8FAE